MPERVYFDTVAFREIGRGLEKDALPAELRDRILISPLTVFEVWSQLTIVNADEVLRQIHAVLNWVNPKRTGLLAWPDDALCGICFQKPVPGDDFTKRMEKAFNVCLTADSAKTLQDEAGRLKDVMDKMKQKSADDFGRLLETARKEPLDSDKFSDAWFRGITSRLKKGSATRSMTDIISSLSAYHEFEEAKLRIALENKDYNPDKHKNDLLDAEQLIYLNDQTLCFLTCDKGFTNLVKKSEQAKRIVTVAPEELSNRAKIETLLRKLT